MHCAPFRFRIVIAAALSGLVATPLTAQNVGAANPRVDSIFAEWSGTSSPGCALGVYRDGEIVYSRGYGMADVERHVPITPHTVFDIGSTSKQFTAASIVLLAQQGKLSLDDDIRRYIPELPAYSRPITIRQLLNHTSGLRDYIGLLTLAGARIDDVTTADDALDAIARQKELNFEPGDEHLYSNSGFFLLSIVVERVAGESLRDFAREQIFAPLGMKRTHYLGSYDDIVPDRALAYSPADDGGLRTDISRWLQLGDGAVFTTVEELLLWDRNFYDPKVGGQALLDELHTRGVLTSGDTLSYALGLMHGEYRGQRTVSHGGSWGGYRAELMRFPDQRFSVATLCNLGTTNPSQLSGRVADVFLENVLTPRPLANAAPAGAARPTAAASVAIPEATLRALAGTYRNSTTRAVRTIEFDDGALYLTGNGRYALRAVGATTFELVDVPVDLTLEFTGPSAGARRLTWTIAGQQPVQFDRIEVATPNATELAAYAGAYHSDELDATYTLSVDDGALTVHRRSAEPQALQPLTRDEFSAGSMTARFLRAADGTIEGFVLDLGRIRNLRFDRIVH